MRNGNNRIIFRQLLGADRALLHRRKDHWRCWQQLLAMALDEIGGGRADGDNEINRPIGVKSAKIIYKCKFRIFTIPGIHQRLVEKLQLLPTSAYLGPNGPLVVAPGFETRTERMQHQNAFGRWIGGLTLT